MQSKVVDHNILLLKMFTKKLLQYIGKSVTCLSRNQTRLAHNEIGIVGVPFAKGQVGLNLTIDQINLYKNKNTDTVSETALFFLFL